MRTRRRILQGLTALLAACGRRGEILWGDDSGTAGTNPGDGGSSGPVTTPYSTGATGWTLLEFADHPELLQPDGYIHVTVGGVQLVVTAGEADGTWVAMDRICSHQGCDIVIRFGRIACPCHGSLWNDKGELVGGPARNQEVYNAYGGDLGVWVHVP